MPWYCLYCKNRKSALSSQLCSGCGERRQQERWMVSCSNELYMCKANTATRFPSCSVYQMTGEGKDKHSRLILLQCSTNMKECIYETILQSIAVEKVMNDDSEKDLRKRSLSETRYGRDIRSEKKKWDRFGRQIRERKAAGQDTKESDKSEQGESTVTRRRTRSKPPVAPKGKPLRQCCALCELEFPSTQLLGRISMKAVANWRKEHRSPFKSNDKRLLFSQIHNMVKVCLFCFQFFDTDYGDYIDQKGIINKKFSKDVVREFKRQNVFLTEQPQMTRRGRSQGPRRGEKEQRPTSSYKYEADVSCLKMRAKSIPAKMTLKGQEYITMKKQEKIDHATNELRKVRQKLKVAHAFGLKKQNKPNPKYFKYDDSESMEPAFGNEDGDDRNDLDGDTDVYGPSKRRSSSLSRMNSYTNRTGRGRSIGRKQAWGAKRGQQGQRGSVGRVEERQASFRGRGRSLPTGNERRKGSKISPSPIRGGQRELHEEDASQFIREKLSKLKTVYEKRKRTNARSTSSLSSHQDAQMKGSKLTSNRSKRSPSRKRKGNIPSKAGRMASEKDTNSLNMDGVQIGRQGVGAPKGVKGVFVNKLQSRIAMQRNKSNGDVDDIRDGSTRERTRSTSGDQRREEIPAAKSQAPKEKPKKARQSLIVEMKDESRPDKIIRVEIPTSSSKAQAEAKAKDNEPEGVTRVLFDPTRDSSPTSAKNIDIPGQAKRMSSTAFKIKRMSSTASGSFDSAREFPAADELVEQAKRVERVHSSPNKFNPVKFYLGITEPHTIGDLSHTQADETNKSDEVKAAPETVSVDSGGSDHVTASVPQMEPGKKASAKGGAPLDKDKDPSEASDTYSDDGFDEEEYANDDFEDETPPRSRNGSTPVPIPIPGRKQSRAASRDRGNDTSGERDEDVDARHAPSVQKLQPAKHKLEQKKKELARMKGSQGGGSVNPMEEMITKMKKSNRERAENERKLEYEKRLSEKRHSPMSPRSPRVSEAHRVSNASMQRDLQINAATSANAADMKLSIKKKSAQNLRKGADGGTVAVELDPMDPGDFRQAQLRQLARAGSAEKLPSAGGTRLASRKGRSRGATRETVHYLDMIADNDADGDPNRVPNGSESQAGTQPHLSPGGSLMGSPTGAKGKKESRNRTSSKKMRKQASKSRNSLEIAAEDDNIYESELTWDDITS